MAREKKAVKTKRKERKNISAGVAHVNSSFNNMGFYSVFGFIFGNRTIRFFVAWTYITVLPFVFFQFPGDWLNIRYLYLVSIGFIMLLSSATVLASRLLYQRAWRRFLPYALPLVFVLLSGFVISHLDRSYERMAGLPRIEKLKQDVLEYRDAVEAKK